MRSLWLLIFWFVFCLGGNSFANVEYGDVFYSSGPLRGTLRTDWVDMAIDEKTFYLEKQYGELVYCLDNLWRNTKELDRRLGGNEITGVAKITYGLISLKYGLYMDSEKAAEYQYKDWLNFKAGANWEPLDDRNMIYKVIDAYEEAGLYLKALPFYKTAHEDMLSRYATSTDVDMLKTDFAKYQKRWPIEAKEYSVLMRNWQRARKLAKTTNPKPLDPAVQNHEWFYSDKQEDVLKALDYYFQNKVQFMLEKAVSHKDPVVAAKAKEYLETLKKGEKNETENKKP